MKKLLKIFTPIAFAAWLIIFCLNIPVRIQTVYKEIILTNGQNDGQKRTLIYGDFYKFVISCNAQIPENSTVFLISDSFFEYYYSCYYLYPRKVLVNAPGQRVDGLSNNPPVNLTKEFCLANNVSYVIIPREFRIINVAAKR